MCPPWLNQGSLSSTYWWTSVKRNRWEMGLTIGQKLGVKGVPGTRRTFPCSLQTFTLWQPSSPPKSLSPSLVPFVVCLIPFFSSLSLQHSGTKFPQCKLPPASKDRTTGYETVRGHGPKPASTFRSLLQLTPHVVSALATSDNMRSENKGSKTH